MLTTIIVFIVVLSVLVFAHEFGHFWTARKFGAKVEEFGFGLPPRVFGVRKDNGKWQIVGAKDRNEGGPTVYSINWIPVGGFVKIKGEDGEDKNNPESFSSKPIWQRLIMISSGVVMNLVLCALLLIVGFGVGLPSVISDDASGQIVSDARIQVWEVFDGLPAQEAGIQSGDIILSIDNHQFSSLEELNDYLSTKQDQDVFFKLKRGNEEILQEIGVVDYQDAVGIGVSTIQTGIVRYPWYLAIWQGIKMTGIWLVTLIMAFAMLIKNFIIGAPIGVEVAGPVGIAVMTGQFARMGFVYILQFTALLSLNLAIINFVPFPALDGGRVLFLFIEKIRGRAMRPQIENVMNNIGFLLLMLLILVITFKDVITYGGGVWQAIKNLVGL